MLLSQHLRQQDVLTQLTEGIRFEQRRFGHYKLIDFLVVLFGYAISGERTLQRLYEALRPWSQPFMALFGRDRLPSRSALSRALASLTMPVIDALRTVFLADVLARPLAADAQVAGLWDRPGQQWKVFDIDGTREAARQRALPSGDPLPASQRRLTAVCAPGYTGRKRGEVVRTRTTVLQTHSHQGLGSFDNTGNGEYRKELRQVVKVIGASLTAHQFSAQPARLAPGWSLWDGSGPLGSGGLRGRSAGQGRHRTGSPARPGPAAFAR